MKITALLPILITSLVFIVGCDSGESEIEQPAAQLDVDGGLGPEMQPEAGKDVAPDVDQSSEAGQDAPTDKPDTSLCGTIGKVDGDGNKILKVYFKGPYVADRFIALAGYLIDPNYVKQNAGFAVWCWAGDGNDEVFCSPITKDGNDAIAYQGGGVVVAPGSSPTATDTNVSGPDSKWTWYCEQDSCPVGTLVVCAGKDEVCRIENGAKSGTAGYEKNKDGWSNAKCTF